MHRGHIKIWRKFKEWEWYQDINTKVVFLHLLLCATHKKTKWQGITLNPGQLITGRKKLSKELRITTQVVRTSLKRLKSTSQITIKTTNKFSIITICNWPLYNSKSTNKSTSNLTNNQPTTNQQLTTYKNIEECRSERTRARENFFPPHIDEVIAYAKGRGVDVEKWFAFYQANGWMIGANPMKDWQASIRKWAKVDRERNPMARLPDETYEDWQLRIYKLKNV